MNSEITYAPNPQVGASVAPTLVATATASVGPTTLFTTPTAGIFRVSAWLDVTVAGSGGTYIPNVVINPSDGHSFTIALCASVNAAVQWSNSFGNGNAPMATFYADAGAVIQYQIVSTATGTPSLRYAFTLERLQ